jgi:hypothetical protein
MFSLFSLPASFTWQASILLSMHEANTSRFITHVSDLNCHHFSLTRWNQALQSVLLCPRTSYLTNYDKLLSACIRNQPLSLDKLWPCCQCMKQTQCLRHLCPVGTMYISIVITISSGPSVCAGMICTFIWHKVCAPDSALPRIVPTCHRLRLRSFLRETV